MEAAGQDWSGRTVVVTGGNSGMGRATAELLRRRGASVAVVDRNVEPQDQQRAGELLSIRADVSQEDQVRAAFEEVDRRFGRLDGVFSNAGIARLEGLIHQEAAAEWDEVIAVNLRGTFLVLREALRRMLPHRRGSIVCTSSAVAHVAIPGGTNAYTASKGAINALVRQVAVDYAPFGIRVNAVAPGAIDTPLMWATTPADELDGMRSTIDKEVPLRRIGRPEEIAKAVVWLLSDDASYATGAVYHVDGGAAAQMVLSV